MSIQMFLFSNLAVLLQNLWPRLIATPLGRIPSDGRQLLQFLRRKREYAAEIHAMTFALEGAECHQQGEYEAAQAWFHRGLKLYPDNLCLLFGFHDARDAANELSDRHLTVSVASKTNQQFIKTLRRSQGRVPVRWSALVRCVPHRNKRNRTKIGLRKDQQRDDG